MPHHEAVLRIVYSSWRTSYRWPTVESVDRALFRRGGQRIGSLGEGLDGFVVVEEGLVKLTVAGLNAVDEDALELSLFVHAVRRCFDIYVGFDLGAEARDEQANVALDAYDLFPGPHPEGVTRSQLTAVGALLEVEGVGQIAWSSDSGSPFSMAVGPSVFAYAGVGTVADFLAS